MINEDYVSFETAKLLKEKGFYEKCRQYYYKDNLILSKSGICNEELNNYKEAEEGWSAPTLQMATKWLREKKGIAIIPVLSSVLDNEKFLWDIKIVVAKTGERYSQGWVYEKQEDACETAIKYCLENLI